MGYNKGNISNSLWDRITSELAWSDAGTGKTTTEMQDIAIFAEPVREAPDDP